MKKAIFILIPALLLRVLLIGQDSPDIGGVENNVVYFVQRLLRGEALYTDPSAFPWSVAQYPPLYYEAAAGFARMWGSAETWDVFVSGRVLSLLFNLLFAVSVGALARLTAGLDRDRSAWAGALSFLALDITAYARPDSLYLLLWALSLLAFRAGRGGNGALLLSGAVAALAFFSKQTAGLLPLMCGGWLLWHQRGRGLPAYLGGWAAVAAALLWLHRPLLPMYQNAILGLDNGLSPRWFWQQIAKGYFLRQGLIPLVLSGWLLWRMGYRVAPPFLRWAWIASFFFGLGSSFKFGSTPGYFTEWTVLTLVLVIRAEPQWWRWLPVPLLLWTALQLPKAAGPFGRKDEGRYRTDEAVLRRLQGLGARTEDTVFFNLYSPESFLNNLRPRTAVLPQFEVVIFATWKREVFEYDGFKKLLARGGAPWLVTKRRSPAFMDLPLTEYSLTDSINGHYIYRFNPAPRP